MLEDFIKKAEKAQRTIEIIEKEEWEYIKEWFYESIQDEAPTVIENLAKRLLGKANESGQIDKWNEAAEFVYQLAMKKGDRRTHDTFEVEQFITNVKYVKENIGDLDIPNPFNNIENKGFFFTGFELLLLFIANLKSYSKIREKAEKKERISDLKYIINNIIALNELGALSNKYVTDVIALDKLKPILYEYATGDTARNELDEVLNKYVKDNFIVLYEAEAILKECVDKKRSKGKGTKDSELLKRWNASKEVLYKSAENRNNRKKKTTENTEKEKLEKFVEYIVDSLNKNGACLDKTGNFEINYSAYLKENYQIYLNYKAGEYNSVDLNKNTKVANDCKNARSIEYLKSVYEMALRFGTTLKRFEYIDMCYWVNYKNWHEFLCEKVE